MPALSGRHCIDGHSIDGGIRKTSGKKRCYGVLSKTFWGCGLKGGNQGDNSPDEGCKCAILW